MRKPLELYVHIPFCIQKCLYCDFLSAPASDETVEQYVKALCRQIVLEAPAYAQFSVATVFFGGGTPSILTAEQVTRLLACIRAAFFVEKDAEITLECNPGTLEASKLLGYRAAGINRLSIGLQSAHDGELSALGRIHTWAGFLDNFHEARAAGFTNINVDLMSALPGQTLSGWLDTLEKVTALSPEHISAYSLIIEEGTPFFERYRDKCDCRLTDDKYPELPTEEEERRMYEETESYLRKKGYFRYEISNYALPGRECRHNTGYWRRTDYLGLGLGASSLFHNRRWRVTENLSEYLAFFAADASAYEGDNEPWKREHQSLSVSEQMEEFMFLGLRLSEGVTDGDFRRQFGTGIREVYGKVLDKLVSEGLLQCGGHDKIKLTSYGVDISNYVLAQFLLDG